MDPRKVGETGGRMKRCCVLAEGDIGGRAMVCEGGGGADCDRSDVLDHGILNKLVREGGVSNGSVVGDDDEFESVTSCFEGC